VSFIKKDWTGLRIKKQFTVTLFFLIIIFFIFELSNIDIFIQDFFYNSVTGSWFLIHEKGSLLDKIFYSGIKIVIIIFGITILFLYLYSFKKSVIFLKSYREGLLIVWLSIILVPVIIGSLKAITNTPCPCHSKDYGGNYPYIKVIDTMPTKITKTFKCFPAGHASGGFALMSLFFLFKTRKNKNIALSLAIFIGWNMGIYKMIIGDHYLSHTIITMLLSWLIILVINKIICHLTYKKDEFDIIV